MARKLISSVLFHGGQGSLGEELVKSCRRQNFAEKRKSFLRVWKNSSSLQGQLCWGAGAPTQYCTGKTPSPMGQEHEEPTATRGDRHVRTLEILSLRNRGHGKGATLWTGHIQ